MSTSLAEVLGVLRGLEDAGCRIWVGGGWGVDALAGRQTRHHRDLDLAVDVTGMDITLGVLRDLGYEVETNWLPIRVELHRIGHGRVDVHPIEFDEHGSAVQAGLEGTTFSYPAEGFTYGLIGGVRVPCLSRDLQLAFHAGYQPRDVDNRDLTVLAALRPRSGEC